MEVTWDDRKNEENLKKHGVSFEEALTVFFDSLAKTASDDHSGEQRWITVGHSDRSRLLLVVHFESDEECLRIISARKLTIREQRDYEEGI